MLGQLDRILKSQGGVDCERSPKEAPQRGRQIRPKLAKRARLTATNALQRRGQVIGAERPDAAQDLERHDRQRPQVRPFVEGQVPSLLGAHVRR
jgi:hypothetical protein